MVANILLLDDSVVARCAMQGILTRGHHRCAVAATEGEAWTMLRSAVSFDLVIVEATLKGGSGLDFIQRLRGDCFLRPIPTVVYSTSCEQRLVRRAIGLKSQNYLLKPYDERVIYAEVAKAAHQRWRNVTFEEELAQGPRTGLELDELRRQRLELRTSLPDHAKFFEACAEGKFHSEAIPRLIALTEAARAAGFPALVEHVGALQVAAEAGKWAALQGTTEVFELAGRLMFCQMNPTYVPDILRSEEERQAAIETKERARWAGVDLKSGIRPFSRVDWESQVDALPGCPVIDSVAASFQMMADSRATALNQLMDVVSRDPGLSVQVLAAANHLERGGDTTPVEDARTAASLLGGLKLHALSLTLPKVAERHFRVPPLTWPLYWMFQVGVARMTQHICTELELGQLGTAAYNAGLLHDLGRLLLVKLQPMAWQAILAHAQQSGLPVIEVEKLYLDCTTRDLGARFVSNQELPPAYANVIRWVDAPDEAPADQALTAIVALARHFCLHQRIGTCGDTAHEGAAPVDETRAWRVLRQEVFPSFDHRKFEATARTQALRLRQELLGRMR